jgi:hypothetical protein
MPAFPYDNSGIQIEMNTDRWWDDPERGDSSIGRKLATVPLCPPQISHGLT